MKRKELLKALLLAKPFTGMYGVLSLVKIEGGTLFAANDDMELALSLHATELRATETGLLPCKNAIAALRASDAEEVEIRVSDESFNPGTSLVLDNSFIRFSTPEMADYPAPTMESLSYRFTSDLKKAFGFTVPFCIKNETRKNLMGVSLQMEGDKVCFSATDGHRLCRYGAGVTPDKEIIVPSLAIEGWLKVPSGPAHFYSDERHFTIKSESATLSGKLIEGKFPGYNRVIPKSFVTHMLIDTGLLKNAVAQISSALTERNKAIKLVLKNGCLVVSTLPNGYGTQATQSLAVKYEGPDISIGINAVYLLDVLKAAKSDTIRMEFGGNLSPIVIKTDDPDLLFVVMPLRIEQ